MPIKIPNALPARKILEDENIFVMTETRARTQDIRPLKIALLNLMPTKITTETQISRLVGNTPLQVELTLVQTSSHRSTHVSESHMQSFYKTFDDIKSIKFDGMIITGAPVEQLDFEDVDYWQELCEIMDWTRSHVHSTFHICWGAQAALYHHFGVRKYMLGEKLFGVFSHRVVKRDSILMRGFDDEFYAPHSRHTTVRLEDVESLPGMKILSLSDKAGLYACCTSGGRQVYIMGHSEYDRETLASEYLRDVASGAKIHVPDNYFEDDDPTKPPKMLWRGHANLLYSNWLNYFVYQTTPYEISEITPV